MFTKNLNGTTLITTLLISIMLPMKITRHEFGTSASYHNRIARQKTVLVVYRYWMYKLRML